MPSRADAHGRIARRARRRRLCPHLRCISQFLALADGEGILRHAAADQISSFEGQPRTRHQCHPHRKTRTRDHLSGEAVPRPAHLQRKREKEATERRQKRRQQPPQQQKLTEKEACLHEWSQGRMGSRISIPLNPVLLAETMAKATSAPSDHGLTAVNESVSFGAVEDVSRVAAMKAASASASASAKAKAKADWDHGAGAIMGALASMDGILMGDGGAPAGPVSDGSDDDVQDENHEGKQCPTCVGNAWSASSDFGPSSRQDTNGVVALSSMERAITNGGFANIDASGGTASPVVAKREQGEESFGDEADLEKNLSGADRWLKSFQQQRRSIDHFQAGGGGTMPLTAVGANMPRNPSDALEPTATTAMHQHDLQFMVSHQHQSKITAIQGEIARVVDSLLPPDTGEATTAKAMVTSTQTGGERAAEGSAMAAAKTNTTGTAAATVAVTTVAAVDTPKYCRGDDCSRASIEGVIEVRSDESAALTQNCQALDSVLFARGTRREIRDKGPTEEDSENDGHADVAPLVRRTSGPGVLPRVKKRLAATEAAVSARMAQGRMNLKSKWHWRSRKRRTAA